MSEIERKALFEGWVRSWHEYPEQADSRLVLGSWGSGYDDEEIQHKYVGFCAGLEAALAAQQPQGVPEDVQRDAERYRHAREVEARLTGVPFGDVDRRVDEHMAAAPSPERQG